MLAKKILVQNATLVLQKKGGFYNALLFSANDSQVAEILNVENHRDIRQWPNGYCDEFRTKQSGTARDK